MKKALSAIFLLCLYTPVQAESIYNLDPTTDAMLASTALGIFVPSLFLDGAAGSQKPEEDINGIDRAMMSSYDQTMDSVSTYGAYLLLMLPGVSVLDFLDDGAALLTYSVMYSEAFLLTMGTKDLLKAAISRHRPYTYSGPVPEGEEQDYYNSFPSGHTAFAFLGATFLTTTFAHEYPESRWKVPVSVSGYLVAASVAALRVTSGSHFLSDVLAGAAIGSAYGWLIPMAHRSNEQKGESMSILPIPGGLMIAVRR